MSKAIIVMRALVFTMIISPSATLLADAPTTAPTSQPAQALIDVKNTKCVVSPDDDIDPTLTSSYNGKLYHFCCKGCMGEFEKRPQQYVKALEADPAKYGIKK